MRETPGIFKHLAETLDRHSDHTELPIECNPNLFNSLITLCIAQVTALVARKAFYESRSNSLLSKLTTFVSQSYESAITSFKSVPNVERYSTQYLNWLNGCSKLYELIAAIYAGFAVFADGNYGQTCSFMKYASTVLPQIEKIDPTKKLINEVTKELSQIIVPRSSQWREMNARIYSQTILQNIERKLKHAKAAITANPPLPAPFHYTPSPPALTS
jgi:hypothetical protein